ncbi:hypothetical protein EDC01DRAFT_732097 [Geopyxis carbonaria]|nr:hypothetical protein EDC01DRAFT_732097 [Geopyxis carbonaria]
MDVDPNPWEGPGGGPIGGPSGRPTGGPTGGPSAGGGFGEEMNYDIPFDRRTKEFTDRRDEIVDDGMGDNETSMRRYIYALQDNAEEIHTMQREEIRKWKNQYEAAAAELNNARERANMDRFGLVSEGTARIDGLNKDIARLKREAHIY